MLTDYINLVTRRARPDAADDVLSSDITDAIAQAVTRYSKDRPRQIVRDVASPGGQSLALPTEWVAGFSQILQLEYPIGDLPPTTLATWEIYQTPTAELILVETDVPFDEPVRVSFTVFHEVTDTVDTIPLTDRGAVVSLAASLVCDQLAAKYSGDTDSTIQADSVEHGGKAREFAARSRTLRQRYFDDLGINPKANAAAGVVVDLDMPNSLGNDRLLHPGRLR